MGTVYEAFDTVTGIDVALKTWRTASGSDEHRPSRLWREARALAEIEHPAVVRYIDHGQTEEHGPFLAMSWVSGQTLAERLLAPGLSSADACRLVGRLAAGLAAMHGRGVVHRDLKPSNIMLPSSDVGQAVIVDFGIAAILGLSGLTATGAHLGTPRYMAPEQIRNARTVDGLPYIGPHRNFPHHLFAWGDASHSVTGAYLASRVLLRYCSGEMDPADETFGFHRSID